MREPTETKLQLFPVYDLTSEAPWDPKDLDNEDPSPKHFRGD